MRFEKETAAQTAQWGNSLIVRTTMLCRRSWSLRGTSKWPALRNDVCRSSSPQKQTAHAPYPHWGLKVVRAAPESAASFDVLMCFQGRKDQYSRQNAQIPDECKRWQNLFLEISVNEEQGWSKRNDTQPSAKTWGEWTKYCQRVTQRNGQDNIHSAWLFPNGHRGSSAKRVETSGGFRFVGLFSRQCVGVNSVPQSAQWDRVSYFLKLILSNKRNQKLKQKIQSNIFKPRFHESLIQNHLQSYGRGLRVSDQRLLADAFGVGLGPCVENNLSDRSSEPPHPNLRPTMDLTGTQTGTRPWAKTNQQGVERHGNVWKGMERLWRSSFFPHLSGEGC